MWKLEGREERGRRESSVWDGGSSNGLGREAGLG